MRLIEWMIAIVVMAAFLCAVVVIANYNPDRLFGTYKAHDTPIKFSDE